MTALTSLEAEGLANLAERAEKAGRWARRAAAAEDELTAPLPAGHPGAGPGVTRGGDPVIAALLTELSFRSDQLAASAREILGRLQGSEHAGDQ